MGRYYPQARAILQVILDGYGETARDSEPLIIPVLPKAVTLVRNSYKQADSFKLTFEAGDLPIDPDLVRAGAAEIYLFQLSGLEDDRRVLSRRDPLATVGARGDDRTSTDTLALEAGLAAKERFTWGNRPQVAGLFDADDLELDDSGKWVTISGQDYTAHLASLQWKPDPNGRARRIPTGKRIDRLLEEVLREADPDNRLRLDVRGMTPEELPVVGAGEVRGNRRGIPVEQDTTYWDVMYKVATRYGLILYVDGLDVVLSRPRAVSASDQSAIRRLAWGRNLDSLKLRRNLGKEQSPTIVARSYDPKTGKTISVEYPEGEYHRAVHQSRKPSAAPSKFKTATKISSRKSKGGKVSSTVKHRDEYQIITLNGVTDPAVLRRAAENQFHLLGRAEREVTATTRDLRDLRDADMLTMTAGDAVTIDWDEFNRELLADTRVPEGAKVQHLLDRGFNRAVAEEIAARYTRLEGIKRPLRVRELTYEYDVDEGISIEFQLVDFVMIDGIRPDAGGAREPRAQKRRRELVKRDGKQLGGGALRRGK